MIPQTSNKKEKTQTSNTTIRQRRKTKDKITMNLDSENDGEGTELHILNRKENGHKTYGDDDHSVGSDFEVVDSRLMEIDLDNNINEEEDSLIPNLTIDVTNTNESSFFIALQVFFPFFAAGLGTVAAGLLLDHVQVEILKFINFIQSWKTSYNYVYTIFI